METKQKRTKVVVSVLALAALCVFSLFAVGGNLEPSAAPGPTMKTLDEVYNRPIWRMLDKEFVDHEPNPRFAVCDNGTPADESDDMVFDKETGLVWERRPYNVHNSWYTCIDYCYSRYKGGRKGWRLPTIEELASLVDPTQGPPTLPNGHPFVNVQSTEHYWTLTTNARDTSEALCVGFDDGEITAYSKNWSMWAWCVRGGQGHDGQGI